MKTLARKRWTSAMLAVSLCVLMTTVGLMTVASPAAAYIGKWTGSAFTIPSGHYVHEVTTRYLLGGGPLYTEYVALDTNGSLDNGYTFMATVQSQKYTVGTARYILVEGGFSMYDTFDPYLQPDRRYVSVYLLNAAKTTIVAEQKVLDYRDAVNTAYLRDALFTGLMPGAQYYVAVGRADSWAIDWRLTVHFGSISVSTPACPAWPHTYHGSGTISVVWGWNVVTEEWWTSNPNDAPLASAIYYGHTTPSTGLVYGVQYDDQSGNPHQFGDLFGIYIDFVLPFGCSFAIYALGAGTVTMGYRTQSPTPYVTPSEAAETFTQTLQTGHDNCVGRMVDFWYCFGLECGPLYLLPPMPGGPPGHFWASYIGSLIRAPGGGAYGGTYTVGAFNVTSGAWMIYNGSSGTDYPMDQPHTGLRISVSQVAQINWSVS